MIHNEEKNQCTNSRFNPDVKIRGKNIKAPVITAFLMYKN